MRLHIIRTERIETVGKYQSCMVSKVRIICKQTVQLYICCMVTVLCVSVSITIYAGAFAYKQVDDFRER